MSEFIVCKKQHLKSSGMIHYFHLDSVVCIGWTLYYPMSPRERRLVEFQNGEKRCGTFQELKEKNTLEKKKFLVVKIALIYRHPS